MCCHASQNIGIGDFSDYAGDVSIFQTNPTPIYNTTGTSIYTPPSTGTNWLTALTQGLTSASSILGARYAVPQLNPGQLIQTGPYGTTMSQSATGTPLTSLGGSSSLLLIGGALLVVLMIAKK